MQNHNRISNSVIRRLPRYYRYLAELMANGITRVSSNEISHHLGSTASQIRQDLNCFGGFGQQGYGYNVETLHRKIGEIIGTSMANSTIIIGAGNIGHAIAMDMNFESMGFSLKGIFDINPAIIGTQIRGITIQSIDKLEDFCKNDLPRVAILTLPQDAAPGIVECLVNLGVTGFWNFSHYDFVVKYQDKGIIVENVHLADSLMALCYMIKNNPGTNAQAETV